jgi:serine/threonine protein kinase
LPRVTDYFSFGASDFLVMDFVEGVNLQTLVQQRGAQAEATVIAWANQLLDALASIHARGVIHRDIKPLNIILTPDGRVMLVDFGLVKVLDPNNPYTAAHIRGMGTAGYAPIEQYATSTEHTDARTDLYALGATMYFLLTARVPIEVHQRVVNPATLLAPRALNANISAQTESVILRAMQVQPQNRYASAGEMKQAMNARATALTYPMPRDLGISLPVISGILAVMLLCVLVGAGSWIFLNMSTPTPTPTISPTHILPAPTAPAPTLKVGQETFINGVEVVGVPAGEFKMGSDNSVRDANNDEKPQHTVYLDAFWIGKYFGNVRLDKRSELDNCSELWH